MVLKKTLVTKEFLNLKNFNCSIPSAARHIGKTNTANASTKFYQRAFQPFPR